MNTAPNYFVPPIWLMWPFDPTQEPPSLIMLSAANYACWMACMALLATPPEQRK